MYAAKLLSCSLLYLLCSCDCFAQDFPDLKFSHLSTGNGLSSDNVRCILQDHRGIMWIATFDGLNRYDGTGFKIFRHSGTDSSSIPANDLRNMVLDGNTIWISTANGLSKFNTITGKAENYYHKPGDKNSLAGNYESNPFIDSKNRLWLATHAGVQRFDREHNIFITYTMPPVSDRDCNEHFNHFMFVREDVQGRLWAGSFFGLYRIDEQQLIPYYQVDCIANNGFYSTLGGPILLAQWSGGVKKFFPAQNRYERVTTGNGTYSIANDFGMWKDKNAYEWLCIAQDGGLLLMDMRSGRYKLYRHDVTNPLSLNAFFVHAIFRDPENRLWLSTDNGISIIDPQLQYFSNHYLYQQVNMNNPKAFGIPRSMLQTDNGYLLSAWFNKGLFYVDSSWKLTGHKERIPENSASFASGAINDMYRDDKGSTWFSTDSGLVRSVNGQYSVFTAPGSVSVTSGDYIMRNILRRNDGLFWVRAKQNGIYLFDPGPGKFLRQYRPGKKGLAGDVLSLRLDKNSMLWVGTDSGMFLFDERKDIFKRTGYRQGAVLRDFESVSDMICDDSNILWLATVKGLGKIDVNTGAAELLNTTLPVPDESMFRILEDSNHVIWIKALKGIIRYDKKAAFRFFTSSNGLPDLYNSYGLFDFNKAGNILSGHNGVLTEFNPYTIGVSTKRPHVILCDAYADNKTPSLLSPDHINALVLEPGQQTLQVHFSIAGYTSSSANRFFYRMPGIAGDWVEVPNGNINFSNLPIGEHTLYLKASNNDGFFSEEEKVHITVKPYWYQTILFKLLLALLVAIGVIVFVRWRIRSIRRQASFRQKIAETEMQALRAQMNPHFIFNSLNSIENFIMQNEKRLASDYLNKFARLIRMILDSSRNELVPLAKDMEALQLYIDLEQLRFNHKFSYRSFIDPVLLHGDYRVPSLLVQPYVENAIVHGLSHSEEKNLELSISVEAVNDSIRYIIQDNGIGREKAKAYNLQNKPYHKSVGLVITEERIRQLNRQSGGNSSVLFTDRYDGDHKPSGTKVEITIKAG